MTSIPFNTTLFCTTFPELKNAELKLLQVQWNLASQYEATFTADLPILTWKDFLNFVAHLVKLNFMAQLGEQVRGFEHPILQPPVDRSKFKEWLQQTRYGRAIG